MFGDDTRLADAGQVGRVNMPSFSFIIGVSADAEYCGECGTVSGAGRINDGVVTGDETGFLLMPSVINESLSSFMRSPLD